MFRVQTDQKATEGSNLLFTWRRASSSASSSLLTARSPETWQPKEKEWTGPDLSSACRQYLWYICPMVPIAWSLCRRQASTSLRCGWNRAESRKPRMDVISMAILPSLCVTSSGPTLLLGICECMLIWHVRTGSIEASCVTALELEIFLCCESVSKTVARPHPSSLSYYIYVDHVKKWLTIFSFYFSKPRSTTQKRLQRL